MGAILSADDVRHRRGGREVLRIDRLEVGAATMVGGNIHGQTQVLTTAIVEDVGKGDFTPALAYGGVLLALAFAVNAVLTSVQQRGAAWAQS